MNLRNYLNFTTLLFISLALMAMSIFGPKDVQGYGECSEYGLWSYYDSFTNTCKCMSGYQFGRGVLGSEMCVSSDSICHDQLGYSSRYNSYTGNCECTYGNIIDGGKCTNANTVCFNDHGINSNYDSLARSCKCDSGYTFNDDYQCVRKQNNVYFYLKEIKTDTNEAIIQSAYDYRYYTIKYGYGCLDYSFRQYVGKNIVVNLGTDYTVDFFDKIVLQEHDQICDITKVSNANRYTTFVEEIEEEESYFSAPSISNNNTDVYEGSGVNEEVPADLVENLELSVSPDSSMDEIVDRELVIISEDLTQNENNSLEELSFFSKVKSGFFNIYNQILSFLMFNNLW